MKKIYLTILYSIFYFTGFCGNVKEFFETSGARLLASVAHPTNTYVSSNVTVTDAVIIINVLYQGEQHIQFKIERLGQFFTSINVEKDDDWLNAFYASTKMKELAESIARSIKQHNEKNKAIKEEQSQTSIRNKLEAAIKRKINEADAKDLTLWMLNYSWLNY